MVVGTGPKARVETVPDIPTRMRAANAVLDRVYGKAKQSVDVAEVTPNRFADKSIEEIDAELAEWDERFRQELERET